MKSSAKVNHSGPKSQSIKTATIFPASMSMISSAVKPAGLLAAKALRLFPIFLG